MIEALEQDRYYRWITYLFLPIQYAGFVGLAYLIARATLTSRRSSKVGLAVSIGCIGGIGINTAHELGHKKESHERWLVQDRAGAELLRPLLHRAQPRPPRPRRDPGGPGEQPGGRELLPVLAAHGRSARCAAPGGWRSAATPARQQHPFRIGNDVLNAWLMSRRAVGGAGRLARASGILPYLRDPGGRRLLAARGRQLHGALRDAAPEGRRRRAASATSASTPRTSWNSNNIATNVLLYHLQRHSDHHANPTRRYQALRDFEESPVLPTGYAGMIVLALVPPVWRRVMDPRVLAHFDGDVTRANLAPRKRDALLATYPPPAAPGCRAARGGGGTGRTARSRRLRRTLPGLRLHLRGRRRRARGLRGRHRLGRRPRRAGAAPTAASATRSTSCADRGGASATA